MAQRFWVETLGCPKNRVDSDKLVGTLLADGLLAASSPDRADVVVVNTCAFVEEARAESIETILALADVRRPGARLVVTGCLAERSGAELAEALPEVDLVAGFGMPLTEAPIEAVPSSSVPVSLGRRPGAPSADRVAVPAMDLLELPRPAASAPWAYVKVAEGCDRACGFCAIPSFRGPQRSRSTDSVLAEVDTLVAGAGGMPVREVVLVAQDLASYGRDQGVGQRQLVALVRSVAERVERVRLLYLYPSDLDDRLVDAVLSTGVPYFDLSLQHVSRALLRRMRRWGDGDRFLARIDDIRRQQPDAVFRSNFIVGYPGETEEDHDRLLEFIDAARLDWCGFFRFSEEPGTYAAGLDATVDEALVADRLAELSERQDALTLAARDVTIGQRIEVLVDEPGIGRSFREAPEIDGVVHLPVELSVGELASVTVTASLGVDLVARR